MGTRHAASACFLIAFFCGFSIAQTPPFTAAVEYRSGQTLSGGFGTINSPFFFPNGGDGIVGLHITTDGDLLAHVEVQSLDFEDAVLFSPSGLSPLLTADDETFFSGGCGSNVPCEFHIVDQIFSVDVNNNDDRVYVMSLLGLGPGADDEDGVFWDADSAIVLQGETIAATGLAAGATASVIDENTFVELNDANQLLVSLDVDESGNVRRALILFDLDSSGQILSAAVVAKESGPVNGGPATWTEIGVGPHSQALNGNGSVLFSGTTSEGVTGLYKNGSFVATEGGPAPGGLTWSDLLGQPVDLSNKEMSAFRGVLSPLTPFVWTEIGDAGQSRTLTNQTIGTGELQKISGALDNEHDVDLYLINITDPDAFSATTVPTGGSTGAAFDSVLYLFLNGFNANGVTRSGLARSDDLPGGVLQSEVTGQFIADPLQFGPNVVLGISTNKAIARATSLNAVTDQFEPEEIFNSLPRDFQVYDGVLYWPDGSTGEIQSADITTGLVQTPLSVSNPPDDQMAFGEEFLQPALAIDPLAENIYFLIEFDDARLVNIDGTGETSLGLSGEPILAGVSDFAFDDVNNKLFWSDLQTGEIWTSAPDGSGPTAVFNVDIDVVGSLSFDEIAVDPTGGKIYWHNPLTDEIGRSNLDGTSPQNSIVANAGVAEMAIDVAGRKLFWTQTLGDKIRSLDLDTLAVADVIATPAPVGLAYDPDTDMLFWSSPTQKGIFEAPASGGTPSLFLSTPDDAERTSTGPGWDADIDGDAWLFTGSAGSGPLPYEIALTGAAFSGEAVAIARSNSTIIAQTSEVLPEITPATLTAVGTQDSPLRITDLGDVIWFGRWSEGGVVNERGVFWNRGLLFDDDTTVSGVPSGATSSPGPDSPFGMDVSDDGQHVAITAFNGSFFSPPSFSPGDLSVVIDFTCPGTDFDGDGSPDTGDIQQFVSDADSNPSDPCVDLDVNGQVDVFDLLKLLLGLCLP